jgi:DNA-binding XRE family transcriptional regulator
MTNKEYRDLRKVMGTQKLVADLLGVRIETVSNRERGVYNITSEAKLAMVHIHSLKTSSKLKWPRWLRLGSG